MLSCRVISAACCGSLRSTPRLDDSLRDKCPFDPSGFISEVKVTLGDGGFLGSGGGDSDLRSCSRCGGCEGGEA
jgi:hypothetical protein